MNEIRPWCVDERAEEYVAGRMDIRAVELFEQHLIACEACALRVLGLEHMRVELEPAAPPVRRRHAAATGALALAASLLLAVTAATIWWMGSAGAPSPAVRAPEPAVPSSDRLALLASLAEFEPPPYLDLATRGASGNGAAFDRAMALYNRREFRAAAAVLQDVVGRQPDVEVARLFLGISLLADGRAAEALMPLKSVAGQASPYSPLAHLMIGRAYLKIGNVEAGRAAFTSAAAAGDAAIAGEASALLLRLTEQHESSP